MSKKKRWRGVKRGKGSGGDKREEKERCKAGDNKGAATGKHLKIFHFLSGLCANSQLSHATPRSVVYCNPYRIFTMTYHEPTLHSLRAGPALYLSVTCAQLMGAACCSSQRVLSPSPPRASRGEIRYASHTCLGVACAHRFVHQFVARVNLNTGRCTFPYCLFSSPPMRRPVPVV